MAIFEGGRPPRCTPVRRSLQGIRPGYRCFRWWD